MRASLLPLISIVLACGSAGAQEAAIEGKWMRGDGNALVDIAPCGANICATNLWIRDGSRGEAVGDRLVMSLSRESADSFTGTIYDPKRKLRYSVVLTAGNGRMTTRGCFLGKLICKDVSWTRAR